jgi:hypothetical protein
MKIVFGSMRRRRRRIMMGRRRVWRGVCTMSKYGSIMRGGLRSGGERQRIDILRVGCGR